VKATLWGLRRCVSLVSLQPLLVRLCFIKMSVLSRPVLGTGEVGRRRRLMAGALAGPAGLGTDATMFVMPGVLLAFLGA
jgi:hypothetical protein